MRLSQNLSFNFNLNHALRDVDDVDTVDDTVVDEDVVEGVVDVCKEDQVRVFMLGSHISSWVWWRDPLK